MVFWIARPHFLKQSNLKIKLSFLHIFMTYSLRPISHRSMVPFEVALILHCIMETQPIDVGALVKAEIQKIGCNELESNLLPFLCLITEMCRQTGVDVSRDQMSNPPINLG